MSQSPFQFPAAAPAYPQAFGQQPFQPQAPAFGQPQSPAYPQQFQPQVVPQQYPMMPQGVPAQPRPPLPQGTLDDYYAQPSASGGPSVTWKDAQVGSSITGVVARDVNNGDVRADTDTNGQPKYYRDGRPKYVLVVPLRVQPSQAHPEGEAALWVRGQLRDELQRAMTAAGAEGSPKAGDVLQVTFTGTRAGNRPGMQPSRQFAVQYHREGSTPAPQAQPQQAPAAIQVPQQAAPQVPAQPVAQQQVPVQPQPAGQPAAANPALAGMTAEQAELFAKLAAGQA